MCLFINYSFRNQHISDFFLFFIDAATTEIYTLSLHDALPLSAARAARPLGLDARPRGFTRWAEREAERWCSAVVDRARDRMQTALFVVAAKTGAGAVAMPTHQRADGLVRERRRRL